MIYTRQDKAILNNNFWRKIQEIETIALKEAWVEYFI